MGSSLITTLKRHFLAWKHIIWHIDHQNCPPVRAVREPNNKAKKGKGILIPHLHDRTGLTTGWMFVYTIQPVVKPVSQPCWTNSCSFTRLSNRVEQLVWQQVALCKRGLRNRNMWQVMCSPRPPTLSRRHVDLRVWLYPRRSCIFQVSSKSLQEFFSPRGRNLPIPITLAICCYSSLHHCASHDVEQSYICV